MKVRAFVSIGVLLFCVTSCGRNPTLAKEITYGMTQTEVLANLEKTQKVISQTPDTLISEGYDSTWKADRRNTFVFRGGKLVEQHNVAVGR